jgi:hypothetical protein
MWDISQLLMHVKSNYTDNFILSLQHLLTKMIILVMIFSACRFPELTRLSVDPLVASDDTLTLVTVTKTHLDERTPITLHRLEDPAICPLRVVCVWLSRTGLNGTPLFVDPDSRLPLSNRAISARIRTIFGEAGIPPIYGAYSVKHAVISYLFSRNVEAWRINDWGRWSPGSTAASTFYNVPTTERVWLGYEIAKALDSALGDAPV